MLSGSVKCIDSLTSLVISIHKRHTAMCQFSSGTRKGVTVLATLTIRVLSVVGGPVEDVSLTLVPSDPARWQRWEAQLFCTTDAQGKCTVVGAPLEYLIFILPHGVQSATLEKDEIKERAAAPRRVSLRPAERRSFEIVSPRQK